MIGFYSRYVGPQSNRGYASRPRFFGGHRRPGFFYGRPGYYRFGGRLPQPTAEQQALRSSAAEVARLFVMAARSTRGDAEKQTQLRGLLERFRNELSEFVQANSQQPQQAKPENAPAVEHA
jgi:hypothetical protein